MLIFSPAVHRSASDRDIKQAYRKLSKKYHPDKNKDTSAKDRFVEIAHGEVFYLHILSPSFF
jgi:DnaJ-class molecular chaperone